MGGATQPCHLEEDAVGERFGSAVTGVLNGFDPLVFRGTLLPLVMERGMHRLLFHAGVRLLDFKRYALATSESVREASLREALERQRPVRYLQWSPTDKEALAHRLLQEHLIRGGEDRQQTKLHEHLGFFLIYGALSRLGWI